MKPIPFHIPAEIQYNSLLTLPCWDFSVTMRHQKKKLIKLKEKWLIIQLKRNNKKNNAIPMQTDHYVL